MAGSLTISTLKNDTGVLSVQNGMTAIPKAWVQFAGASGTINSSFNVSSVTRNGAGNYTLAFTTAMANANYSTMINPLPSTQIGPYTANSYASVTTSGFSFYTVNTATGGLTDVTTVNVIVCGA